MSIETVKHPPLEQLARWLHDTAKLVDTHADHNRTLASVGKCTCITCRARTLGSLSVGFPSSTLGDGTGSRASDNTSSTERAATTLDPWANIDRELTEALRAAWHHTARLAVTIDRILAHAPDDDPLPAGTGPCSIRTCDHVCRPRKKPDDRLRAGLCPACWTSWQKHHTRHPSATPLDWRPIRTAALRPRPAQK